MYKIISRENVLTLPAPFRNCHASTLEVLPNGDIVTAWFGGTEEGAADVAIWSARRSQGVWSDPVKVADQAGIPHWNPVLFYDDRNVLWLFYKVGDRIPFWITKTKRSFDQGLSWTDGEELVKGDVGGRGPVKNKLIRLSNGRLLAPASLEDGRWRVFADISDDGGKTWVPSFVDSDQSRFQGEGMIQPTAWESQPGIVHMLIRSSEGVLYRCDSDDSGDTWSNAYPTTIPNNNSGVDLVKTKEGMLALAHNPVGKNWGPRTPLVVSLSSDNGETWGNTIVLEDQPGEFSYPALVEDKGLIYALYTWNRTNLVLQILAPCQG